MKATGIFVKLLIQDGFGSDSPATLLINNFLKSLLKQAYADVLQNRFFRNFPIFAGKYVLESLFNKVVGLTAGNFI